MCEFWEDTNTPSAIGGLDQGDEYEIMWTLGCTVAHVTSRSRWACEGRVSEIQIYPIHD